MGIGERGGTWELNVAPVPRRIPEGRLRAGIFAEQTMRLRA